MKHVRMGGTADRAQRRGLVPFTSFSEYDTIEGKKVPIWFAPD